ncbi:MAG: 16S rRNA (guanine(527)-N(7))-methyltransferase RsmG [Victivallaceae bacterium]|nr:16S rRNA (guanine(527)-N(7))-methyltransferase RsmG [Victivallaceae bacterium]
MIPFDPENLCRQCSVRNPADFISRSGRLYELLSAANRKTNLTRIQSESDYWIKHVADSLLVARYFPKLSSETLRLADIGCGAGFPSLVLASAFPALQITAIDSTGKKTDFVKTAAVTLELNNIEVITGRARELNRQPDYIERFDVVTARAVSDLRTLFRETRNLIKANGQFVFFKTPEQAAKELPEIENDTRKYSLNWAQTEIFSLPGNSGRRLFIYSV